MSFASVDNSNLNTEAVPLLARTDRVPPPRKVKSRMCNFFTIRSPLPQIHIVIEPIRAQTSQELFFELGSGGPLALVADYIAHPQFSCVNKTFHETNKTVVLKDRVLAILSNKDPEEPMTMKDLVKLKKQMQKILGINASNTGNDIPIPIEIRKMLQTITVNPPHVIRDDTILGIYGCGLVQLLFAAISFGSISTIYRHYPELQRSESDMYAEIKISLIAGTVLTCSTIFTCCIAKILSRRINNQTRDLLDKMYSAFLILQQEAASIGLELPEAPIMTTLDPAIPAWFRQVYEMAPALAFHQD